MAKRSLKLPRKINVKGQDYEILKIIAEQSESGHQECLGYTDTEKKVIGLAVDQSESQIYETLIHEMIHACFCEIGVHSAKLSPELEEVIAQSIASLIIKRFDVRLKQ